jgi:hypothetical protein
MARALRQGGWLVQQVLFNRLDAVDQWRDFVLELTAGQEG